MNEKEALRTWSNASIASILDDARAQLIAAYGREGTMSYAVEVAAERLRLAKLPQWAQEAVQTLADAQAYASHPVFLQRHANQSNYTIVGNTPTTGGKLTADDYSKWLATIPEPIEPGTT